MRDTPSETIKNTIMPELLLVIYLTLFNLLFKGICWIVLTLFRIALFIFRWTIEIIIYAIRFLYRQLSKVAAWGWRKGFTHYRTRHSRQLTP